MQYIKERNFIVAYDGNTMQGKWDITTGNFIGKSGKPIKSVPSAFTYSNLPSWYTLDRSYGYAIYCFRQWISDCGNAIYTNNRAARFEQLLSLGIYPASFSDLDDSYSLNAEVVGYVKNECNRRYDTRRVADFVLRKKYAALLEDKPTWYCDTFIELMKSGNYPYEYLKTMLNRCVNEKVASFLRRGAYYTRGITEIVRDYYDICKRLYGSVKVTPNVLTNMGYLYALQKEYEDEHYNDILKEKNDKPYLYFENNDYIVRPLLTREAFHEEGESQHNCVERIYMEKVWKGQTHVVTIRKKSAPNKSYITCEVDNYGRIIQYLLTCNSRPTEEADIKFKRIFAEYIQRKMAR